MIKACTKCLVEKPQESFSPRKNRGLSYKSWCKSCESSAQSERNKLRMKTDPEFRSKSFERLAIWGKKNKTKRLAADAKNRRDKYATNPEYHSKAISHTAKRRAIQLKATPPWLSPEQEEAINKTYYKCSELSLTTGKNHDVDHIVPLQGKSVCGLHVPWNLQILTASENRSKGNAFDDWGDGSL
jgi:5-methylcytosine-specific restriction endonuclease McrA